MNINQRGVTTTTNNNDKNNHQSPSPPPSLSPAINKMIMGSERPHSKVSNMSYKKTKWNEDKSVELLHATLQNAGANKDHGKPNPQNIN